jgi:hypothetical protein
MIFKKVTFQKWWLKFGQEDNNILKFKDGTDCGVRLAFGRIMAHVNSNINKERIK